MSSLRNTCAVLALVSCVDRRTSTNSDLAEATDANDPKAQASDCSHEAAYIFVPGAGQLRPLFEVEARCLMYAADPTGANVYLISTDGGGVVATVAVGDEPTDIALAVDGSELYVALPQARKVLALDPETGVVLRTVDAELPPYRLAAGTPPRVYYVGETGLTAVHEVNMNAGTDVARTSIAFFEPDVQSAADGTTLYVAEANEAGAELVQFDSSTENLTEIQRFAFDGGFGLPWPERELLLSRDGARAYFADRAIDTDTLDHVRGWFGAQPVATTADGAIVATADGLYDAATFVRFSDRPYPGPAALFSADGEWLYEFESDTKLLRRTAITTLVGVHALGETVVPAGALSEHSLHMLIADPNRPLLYGLESQKNVVLLIDRATLLPVRAEIVGSMPTDVALHPDGDSLVIATFGATEVVILDLATEVKSTKQTRRVPGNPFRLDVSLAGRIVYAEQDQLSDVTQLNMEDGEVGPTTTDAVFQPDLTFDATGDWLYVGESGAEGAMLYRVGVSGGVLDFDGALTAGPFVYPARRVFVAAGSVFYAGRQFEGTTLEELAAFDDEIVAVSPDGAYVASARQLFAVDCACVVAGLPVESSLVTFDPDEAVLYQFDNATGAIFVQVFP